MLRSMIAAALAFAVIGGAGTAAEAKTHRADGVVATGFCGDRYGECAAVAAAPNAVVAARKFKATRITKAARNAPAAAPLARRISRAEPHRTGLVTVSTAAGIDVTVAPEFAAPIQGFVADLVNTRGYRPKQIHCFSMAPSHVANSLHFSGRACDFDQHGWGMTARAMYHVGELALKWGLRDGAEFRDWGHIDMGPHLSASRRAAAVRSTPFYGATYNYQRHRARYAAVVQHR